MSSYRTIKWLCISLQKLKFELTWALMFICSVNGLIKLLQLNMLKCFYTIQNVVSITCSSRASSAYFSQLLGIVYPESQSNVIKPTSKGMRRTEK